MAWVLWPDPTSTPCGPLSNGGTFGPGWILGAPSASSFSEGLTPEGTQTSWDKDIPEINQGEGTVPCGGVVGIAHAVWENVLSAQMGRRKLRGNMGLTGRC